MSISKKTSDNYPPSPMSLAVGGRIPASVLALPEHRDVPPRYKVKVRCKDRIYGTHRLINLWYVRVYGQDPSKIMGFLTRYKLKEGTAFEDGRKVEGMRYFYCDLKDVQTHNFTGLMRDLLASTEQYQPYECHALTQWSRLLDEYSIDL